MKNKASQIITVLLLVFAVSGQTANAADNSASDKFNVVPLHPNGINPHRLIYELKPGDTITDEISIENLSNDSKEFDMYATDQYIGSNGVTTFKGSNEEREMAKLIKLESEKLTIQEKENKKLRFTVTIPADQKEGDYTGGIAVVNTEPSKQNALLKIAIRFMTPVDIKVTKNPKHVPAYGEADIFSPQTYYLPLSIAIFLGSMGYFFWEKRKEKKAKKTAAGSDGQNG